MQKKWIWAYVISLHVIILLILLKPSAAAKVHDSVAKILGYQQVNERVEYYVNSLYTFQRFQDAQMPDNQSIFLGDSLVQSLNTLNLNTPFVNFGIGNNTSARMLNAIDTFDSKSTWKNVAVLIGINDLNAGISAEEISANVNKIIKQLPPDTDVYLISALPVSQERETKKPLKAQILLYNDQLVKIAQQNDNVRYIDLHNHFTTSDGFLKPAYDRGDGLHISTKGYTVMAALLNAEISSE
uniref:GDSL-type esterase/lipase family protein n=1 Tax=Ningiella ruwaisensis TaxID=2364274 RepID=UPI00109F3E56|nr:GDSL-type esterase/lipase family protein [Ningiella ruwaisensis]